MDLSQYSAAHFDRGVPCWKEAAWLAVKLVFFQCPAPWPSSLRVILLRAFGARVGRGVVVRSGTNVTFPWRLSVGDHVWIGEGSTILSLAPVTLGDHVCLSQQCFLCTGSHDHRAETFDLVTAPIDIEGQVWIAACAFVGPGVTIGERSVVGAGAVVLRDIPPGSMATPPGTEVRPRPAPEP